MGTALNIKGFLIDLDGVVYQDNKLIEGARDAIEYLKKNKIPFRFLTNTTTKTTAHINEKLQAFGINVPENVIFSALSAAKKFIERKKYKNVFLMLPHKANSAFRQNFDETKNIDAVLIGDMGELFTYELLNRAFTYLLQGADLIAAHKNKYWKDAEKLKLDAGGFVTLLEYAADTQAFLIGKPNADFFKSAIDDMNLKPQDVLMVGDDIMSDIVGAQNCGVKTAHVKTGKFRTTDLKNKYVKPDYVIDSIRNIIDFVINSD